MKNLENLTVEQRAVAENNLPLVARFLEELARHNPADMTQEEYIVMRLRDEGARDAAGNALDLMPRTVREALQKSRGI